jgi:hypothetical protein
MSSLPVGERSSLEQRPPYHELLAPIPRAFPQALQCSPVHFVRAHLGVREARQKSVPAVSHSVFGVCFTDGIWCAGALPLRGQQEPHL